MPHHGLTCPNCKATVPIGHAAHRGQLIVMISSLSAHVVETKERIAKLASKRWTKQFAVQRLNDQALLLRLTGELPAFEGRLAGLRFLERELYS